MNTTKGNTMNTKYSTFADFDLYTCPICDNLTPSVWCEDDNDNHCKYCFDAYGCEGCE